MNERDGVGEDSYLYPLVQDIKSNGKESKRKRIDYYTGWCAILAYKFIRESQNWLSRTEILRILRESPLNCPPRIGRQCLDWHYDSRYRRTRMDKALKFLAKKDYISSRDRSYYLKDQTNL